MEPGSAWLLPLAFVLLCTWAPGASAVDAPEQAAVFTRPNLPCEGQEITITLRLPQGEATAAAAIQVVSPKGAVVLRRVVTPERRGDSLEAQTAWRPSRNGIYRVVAVVGDKTRAETVLPVLAQGRALDFVWWRVNPYVRWATVSTVVSDEPAGAQWLRDRGILCLRWQWGPNLEDLKREGKTDQQFIAEIEKLYTPGEGFWQDGYGIDEFGAYPQTPEDERGRLWIQALINVRRRQPRPLTMVAWHAGGLRDEWMGLYKQAVDFLLLESYVLYYVPGAIGTERIDNDLRSRITAVRGAEAFTRPYGAACKVLLSLDVAGEKGKPGFDLGEMEEVVRFIRREFPEMRGLAFFNSGAGEAPERRADELCFDYFIRPVVTLQPNSLWLDRRERRSQLVAAVSNIGGVDSGAVTVRFLANGKVLGTVPLQTVPAGYSRLSDRSFARLDWEPSSAGPHKLEAEITSAPGSTVLDPHIEFWGH